MRAIDYAVLISTVKAFLLKLESETFTNIVHVCVTNSGLGAKLS